MPARDRRGDLPEVYTIPEVAELFGRQPRTVRGWIADGLLPHVRIGRSIFVPAPALRQLLEATAKPAGKTGGRGGDPDSRPPRKAPQ